MQRSQRMRTGVSCGHVNSIWNACRGRSAVERTPRRRIDLDVVASETPDIIDEQWRAAFFVTPSPAVPETTGDVAGMLPVIDPLDPGDDSKPTSALLKTTATSSSSSTTAKKLLTMDHFDICEKIGKGGMGTIHTAKLKEEYVAEWNELPKIVAIKSITATLRHRNLVRNEIATHAQMSKLNPNVVQLFAHFQDRYNRYLVMEWLKGPDLFKELFDRRRLTELQTLVIMKPVLETIKDMHENKTVHLDINPRNVVFKDKWSEKDDLPPPIRIIDFGLACRFNVRISLRGTPGYIAPEILAKKPLLTAPSMDMWSIGIMFFECLMGFSPYQTLSFGGQLNIIEAKPITVESMAELRNVAQGTKQLVVSCLNFDPAQRPTVQSILSSVCFRLWCIGWPRNDEGSIRNSESSF